MDFIPTKMAKQRKKHREGSCDLHIKQVNDIEIQDFVNPWSFHNLFCASVSDEEVFRWLRNNGQLGRKYGVRNMGNMQN